MKYVLFVVCHEPLRYGPVTRADLAATSMPEAIEESQVQIAELRQRYHDVDSAKVFAVVDEATVDVDAAKTAAAERQRDLDDFNRLKAKLNLVLARAGRSIPAREAYSKAADLELVALEKADNNGMGARTLGILAVSAAALLMKAERNWEAVNLVARQRQWHRPSVQRDLDKIRATCRRRMRKAP